MEKPILIVTTIRSSMLSRVSNVRGKRRVISEHGIFLRNNFCTINDIEGDDFDKLQDFGQIFGWLVIISKTCS